MANTQFAVEDKTGMLDPKPRTAAAIALYARSAFESPFLRLLPELRNRIYSFKLGGNVLTLRPKFDPNDYHPLSLGGARVSFCTLDDVFDDNAAHVLQTLGACHQIHTEARLLPFALSELRCGWIEGLALAVQWALKMPTQASAITTLHVRYILPDDRKAWPMEIPHLKHFNGLQHLHFDVMVRGRVQVRREDLEGGIGDDLKVWSREAKAHFTYIGL
ncbi:hypothetical protein E8E11_007744 [Didymella keratinophila]|nr:hypothetical protein E8E11_007744 [Didymella keratinophila]